eukprot:439090-Prymnesium_polylepis.1
MVEMAEAGNEGLVYGLLTTTNNLGGPLGNAIGNCAHAAAAPRAGPAAGGRLGEGVMGEGGGRAAMWKRGRTRWRWSIWRAIARRARTDLFGSFTPSLSDSDNYIADTPARTPRDPTQRLHATSPPPPPPPHRF